MKGWHKDNYRHSLAARGFTKYYSHKYLAKTQQVFKDVDEIIKEPATKTSKDIIDNASSMSSIYDLPFTSYNVLSKVRAGDALEAYAASRQRQYRPVSVIISEVAQGSYVDALKILNPEQDLKANGGIGEDFIISSSGERIPVTAADKAAVKVALSERAMVLVHERQPVPKDIQDKLDPEFISHLKTMKEAKRREDETPFRKVLRENLKKATTGTAAGIAEAPGEGLAWAKEGYDSLGNTQDFPGVATRFNQLADNPLKKNSVLAGHEEDGMASPLRWMDNENVPRLDQSWAFLGNVENPVMSGTKHSELASKHVSDQVDSLYDGKDKLSETDLSKYDDGLTAFKKGDREGVIKAISELESEENKLKDRWTIVGETHRNILSSNNQQSVFHKSGSNFALDGRSGADKITDQTEKLARVRADLLKSMNKTYTRRALLQGDLTRLNANMLPDKGAPRDVKRLEDVRASSMKIGDIPNPVLRAPNYVTGAPQ